MIALLVHNMLGFLPWFLTALEFERPAYLWLLAVLPVFVAISWQSMTGIEPWRKMTSVIVRSLVVVLLVGTIAGVIYVRPNRDLTVIFLLDQSRSVVDASEEARDELRNRQLDYVRELTRDMPSEDRVGVISFAGQANIEQLPARGGVLSEKLSPVSLPDHTDLGQALRLAYAIAPQDTATRVVLVSDGNENVGDVIREVDVAGAAGIPIDVLHIEYEHGNEVMFDRIVVPSQAQKDQLVPIKLVIRSERAARGKVTLYHDEGVVAMGEDGSTSMPVDLVPGANTLVTQMLLTHTGPHRFRAVFEPDDARMDKIAENNVATGLTLVQGKGDVLLLTVNPDDDQVLVDALIRENVNITMKRAEEAEVDLLNLQQYACVILSNVPANLFNDLQHEALAKSVKDLGNGLIMTGGDEGFAAGGWIGSPVEEVMPVFFEIKHKKVIPQGALVVILHSCELPRGNYWGKQVASQSLRTISSRDYIGILAYTWNPGGVNWEVPIQLARNKPRIDAIIQRCQIGDMPDFESTMDMALKGLRATRAAQKHMIIISDGDPSPPRTQTINGLIQAGITVSTVGIGYGVHVMEQTLRDIANKTGGRFYACRNPNLLPQIFTKEAKVVRRRLIEENPFTPRYAYRLSEVTAGLSEDDIPPLGGLVITSPKPQAEVPLDRPTSDGDDPVLAHWQYELGRSVAFTSGWWPHWGQDWAAWPRYGKLWAQIVRWCMGQQEGAGFEITTTVSGSRGYISIDALSQDTSFLNFLQMRGTVISPELESQNITPVQTGPGHYEATFDIGEHGHYLVNIEYGKPGEQPKMLRAGVSVPYAQEFRDLKSNAALLAQVIERTSGKPLTGTAQLDDVFRHDLPPALSREPVWLWALQWLVIPLFLLDVAVRRLASTVALSIYVEIAVLLFLLFGCGLYQHSIWGWIGAALVAESVGWLIRWRSIRPTIESLTYTVATLSTVGQRSGEALARLRETRRQIREKMDEPRRFEQPPPDRAARFDVGDEKARQMQVGDLSETLGGASKQDAAQQAARKRGERPGEDVTSRLMRAKQRAKRDIEKRTEDKDDKQE